MCKKPEPKEVLSKEVDLTSSSKGVQVEPTHSASKRDNSYDWLLFLVPALFAKVTNVVPIYVTGIVRLVVAHLVLSLHWQFVDKDNYLHKLTQKQLEREKEEWLTAFVLHMWIQVGLQIVFPSMFFSDSSEIIPCCVEALFMHVFFVEPLYYAVHRWLHVPSQMKSMHGFHHLSIKTLPTSALVQNFHEHLVYVATFGPSFFIPFLLRGRQHWVAIAAYLVGFDILNTFGHTNLKVRNPLFTSPYSPLYYLFYTPEFHLGHHAYFNANYTLFMPIWDHIFGTAREYKKKDIEMLPASQQDFVFIGHNGGLGHFLTIPELCFYNVYNDYVHTWMPLKLELMVMHVICLFSRLIMDFYYCSRFCVANEYVGRIVVLVRTPWDYMSPQSYDAINKEILSLMRKEHRKHGTRHYGLGNLNKMKQLNDGGIEISRMIKEDPYLKDKKIRVWTGDTMTVASVLHQILDIPELESLYYIGAGGKVGKAVCELLVKERPTMKIRIFSKTHALSHPNISYSSDLSELKKYEVVLVGKILSSSMYEKAFSGKETYKTRFILDYTVPALPIEGVQRRPENIQHIRIGLLKTHHNNTFLKGHYDFCMGHPENHIVPCHFGCLLNLISGYETDEVGDIIQNDVERVWKMALARGFQNVTIDYD